MEINIMGIVERFAKAVQDGMLTEDTARWVAGLNAEQENDMEVNIKIAIDRKDHAEEKRKLKEALDSQDHMIDFAFGAADRAQEREQKIEKERDAAQNELEETTANYRELLGKKNAENQAQKAEIDRLNGLLKVQEEQAAKTHEAYERAVEDIRGRKKMNIDDFFHVWVGKEWFAIEANKLNSPRRVFGYCECIADGFALMKTLSRELGGYEIEAITATDIPTSKEPGILLILNMPIDKLKEL